MILVTGAKGQLGSEIALELERLKIPFLAVDKDDFNITDQADVGQFLHNHNPASVIHCAAYTAVDSAEDDPETCMDVNARATENLAIICKEINAEILYVSTDYVFDGQGSRLHETDSPKNPISVYGKSKLAGEEAVLRHLDKSYIVRISWVFGQNGNNFVKTMLRLAQEENEIDVVSDQIGSPTYAPDLAKLLCSIVLSGKYGVYHATNEGFCSWAEFAQEIMILSGSKCKINPISSDAYPTKASRPKNSCLSKVSLDAGGFNRLPKWQDALWRFINEI